MNIDASSRASNHLTKIDTLWYGGGTSKKTIPAAKVVRIPVGSSGTMLGVFDDRVPSAGFQEEHTDDLHTKWLY